MHFFNAFLLSKSITSLFVKCYESFTWIQINFVSMEKRLLIKLKSCLCCLMPIWEHPFDYYCYDGDECESNIVAMTHMLSA
jgi:hypothetical protein